jgi:hypothetical protein
MAMRAIIVIDTDPIMHQPTCSLLSPNSARTIGINGAIPNQAKKHRKNANQLMWNARICGVFRLKRSMRVALPEEEDTIQILLVVKMR